MFSINFGKGSKFSVIGESLYTCLENTFNGSYHNLSNICIPVSLVSDTDVYNDTKSH